MSYFSGGAVVKNSPANAGDTRDTGSHPWVGKISWRRNGKPPQYSYLENSVDRRVRQAKGHGATQNHTGLSTVHAVQYPDTANPETTKKNLTAQK